MRDALEATMKASDGSIAISLQLYDTSGTSVAFSSASTPLEKENDKEMPMDTPQQGRPDLRAAVSAQMLMAGTVGVAACGPEDFTCDLRNAVASAQFDIAAGRTEVTECFLHTEVFGW
jgi:hypothetical protein